MALFQRLRKMPVADVSLTLSIGFLVLAILLMVVGLVLTTWVNPRVTVMSMCGIWLGAAILFIWESGRASESEGRVLDLRVMHVLPLVMLVMCIPHFSNWDDISYMLGFLEVLITGAMIIYGLICMRILVLPPWHYWCYLSLNVVSLWLMFTRS